MNIIFMGTPDFAVSSLHALVKAGHQVAAVFTQPDRPAGRGKALKASPVKQAALQLELPVYQPEKIKTSEVLSQLIEIGPDAIVVVAYGQILSLEILELPRYGCINVHASLLPDWRGAAPIHWSIIQGDVMTGVTTMLMDQGLDTGDMLMKTDYAINEDATTGDVHDALAKLGAELLVKTLEQLEAGELKPTPQSGETRYARLLKREHEAIDWTRSALEIHNRIRGLNPWPGAYAKFREENIKVWRSRIVESEALTGIARNTDSNGSVRVDSIEKEDLSIANISPTAQPGEVIEIENEGLLVQTGAGTLLIVDVQPAGKKVMPARDFFLGRRARAGEQFT